MTCGEGLLCRSCGEAGGSKLRGSERIPGKRYLIYPRAAATTTNEPMGITVTARYTACDSSY